MATKRFNFWLDDEAQDNLKKLQAYVGKAILKGKPATMSETIRIVLRELVRRVEESG